MVPHFSFILYAQTTAVLTKVDPRPAIRHIRTYWLTQSLRHSIISFDTNHSLTWMNNWASNRPVLSYTTKARTYNKHFNIHLSVHRKNILIYIQQDATIYSLFHLETALHVSGGTSTHQERKQLYLQHLVFVTPLLLPAVIVEEWELVWVCCGCHPQHTQTSSNSSTIAADSSNRVTNITCCRYSCLRSWRWVVVPPETCRAVSR